MFSRGLAGVLQGRWSLTRRMNHADGSPMGAVRDGDVVFSPLQHGSPCLQPRHAKAGNGYFDVHQSNPLLLYREEGEVELPSSVTLKFHREYLYEFTSEEEAKVYFYQPGNETEHLKFFHDLSLNEQGSSCAEHLCIADLYQVQLNFMSVNQFTMYWKVTGPAKDYEIHSSYEKRPGS